MTTSPGPLLFLSGAGLPCWIWDGVRHELDAQQTQVAPRPHGDSPSLRAYAEAAIASVAAERFTIVAHSAGGIVGAEVCRLVPQRVDGFVAVSAVIPKPGGSFTSAMPLPNRWILGIVMRLAGTRPPESAIRGTLAHGLDEQTVDRIIADFTPEPLSYYRDRVGPVSWPGRRAYLGTTRDRELPSALQRQFAGRLGVTCDGVLPTGHLPMLEDPRALARAIAEFLGE